MSAEHSGIETERKFIIRIPDISVLRRQKGYSASRIEQVYLSDLGRDTHRIRRRLTRGVYAYTETIKRRLSPMSCIEEERQISKEEYQALKKQRDRSRVVVRKVRHTFYVGKQMFEVDIYPFRKHSCVLETEIPSEDTEVTLPPFLTLIKDVTGDRRYSNAALAGAIPEDWNE